MAGVLQVFCALQHCRCVTGRDLENFERAEALKSGHNMTTFTDENFCPQPALFAAQQAHAPFGERKCVIGFG